MKRDRDRGKMIGSSVSEEKKRLGGTYEAECMFLYGMGQSTLAVE